MTPEKEWTGRRNEIPTTAYNAAVYMDKIKHYLMQVDRDTYFSGASALLRDAHNTINKEWFEGEYVSTFIPK